MRRLPSGRIEVDSSLLKKRERILAARSEVLEMLVDKIRRTGGLGDLRINPPRPSGCGACIPEMTTHRLCGRLCLLWAVGPKHSYFKG